MMNIIKKTIYTCTFIVQWHKVEVIFLARCINHKNDRKNIDDL